jgi:hypothetical protein
MTLHKPYLLIAFGLFLAEIAIALFVHDAFVRPFGGDFLVVILVYATLRGLTHFSVYEALVGTLGFAYLIELLQYFNYVALLGLEHIKMARVVMGTSFSWFDMLAYTVGVLFVLVVETIIHPKSSS